MVECLDCRAVESVQPVIAANPNVSVAVLIDAVDMAVGKPEKFVGVGGGVAQRHHGK